MSLVICNQRVDKCKPCLHYDPHEPFKEYNFNTKCTKWGDCNRYDGAYLKVRCTKIEEEKESY